MAPQHIDVTMADGVARIMLNRPDRRNALSLALLRELGTAFKQVAVSEAVRVVVVSGSGPIFSAGHDLNEMIDRPAEFYEELFTECTDVMAGIQAIPQPVIARVHGMATAAGCQLVAACDLAVAADDCWFATPGVKIGLFCSTPMVPIVRSVGRKRALQMLFTGEPIDAATAVDWGLVNTAVRAAELDDAVALLVGKITQHSRDVLGIGKAAFYQQIGKAESDAYDIALPVMTGNAQHDHAQEGMEAFLEKRPPNWSGQR